jgi:16S rRNA C967 or C1407 C5-methylase (RsmB/RsmF family)
MVPAALLNVQHHHAVLDLCAAPGSKTLQVLEGLYSSWRTNAQESSSAPPAAAGPSGVVIANDLSAKRAYGLAARAKPVGSPTASLMVVCVYGYGYVCICVVVTYMCIYVCVW